MASPKFRPVPPEPAHPMIVRMFDDLVALYKIIRDKYQEDIDKRFDEVSRQIGYVVITTVPVTLNVSGKGEGKRTVEIDAENLKGTIFEKALSPVMTKIAKESVAIAPGSYSFLLFWREALKLKLRHDWIESAHIPRYKPQKRVLQNIARAELAKKVIQEAHEPAHWFDSGVIISQEESVLIAAIDEVYPELRLSERIAVSRQAIPMINPEVMEPVHWVPEATEPAHHHYPQEPVHYPIGRLKYAQEPAHYAHEPVHVPADVTKLPEDLKVMMSQLAAMLRQYGY